MVAKTTLQNGRFKLGTIVATPGAIAALQRSGDDPKTYLARHRAADWGAVCEEDRKLNDAAIAHEGDRERQDRVMSVYKTSTGETLWLITECDRSVSTLLLPSEY